MRRMSEGFEAVDKRFEHIEGTLKQGNRDRSAMSGRITNLENRISGLEDTAAG